MEEKLIIITARTNAGAQREFRATHFQVKPFRNGDGLFLVLDNGDVYRCRSIEVEQKELAPTDVQIEEALTDQG